MAKYRLGDIAPVKQGIVPDSDQYWLLNLDAVESNTGNILEYVYVDYSQIGASTVSFNQQNVLYSKLRPYLNKVVLPDRAGYATSEMLPLMPNEKVITREYLTFFLRSSHFVEYINGKTSGAKMPRANTADLKAVEMECPPINEQNRIVSQINSILTIIAHRKNELSRLDELIRARFVEMFGDEKNLMPMSDICSIITDGTHQPPKFKDTGIPFIFVSNITGDKVTYDAEKFIDQDTYDELIKRTPIEIGDVLLSTVGSYGHPAVVKSDKKFLFQRHIAYLKPRREIIDSDYLHGAILSPDAQRHIEEGVKGIAQKTLNLSEIKKMQIPVPELNRQKEFSTFVSQVDKSKFLSAVRKSFPDYGQIYHISGIMQEEVFDTGAHFHGNADEVPDMTDEYAKMNRTLRSAHVEDQMLDYLLRNCKPGDKLPSEFSLAEQFHTSRSTIREVMKSLAAQGLVEIRHGSGTYVISTSASAPDPLHLSGHKDKYRLALELFDVRLMLEPEISAMAAELRSDRQAAELRRYCDETEALYLQGDDHTDKDIEFHTCIARCSGNTVVQALIPVIQSAISTFCNVTQRKLMNETIQTHRWITNAIENKDPIGARCAMTAHLAFNRDMIQKMIRARKEP